jgi:hypothetical protein
VLQETLRPAGLERSFSRAVDQIAEALPQKLAIGCTAVTDAGVKELAALTRLEELYLQGTKVSDESVRDLIKLRRLPGAGPQELAREHRWLGGDAIAMVHCRLPFNFS